MRQHIKLIGMPFLLQAINYYLNFFSTQLKIPTFHVYIPITVFLMCYISYRSVMQGTSIWKSALLGSTLSLLPPLLTLIRIPFYSFSGYGVSHTQELLVILTSSLVLFPVALFISSLGGVASKIINKRNKGNDPEGV